MLILSWKIKYHDLWIPYKMSYCNFTNHGNKIHYLFDKIIKVYLNTAEKVGLFYAFHFTVNFGSWSH